MFHCDRLRATLRPEACLQFQHLNAEVLKKGVTVKWPKLHGLPRIVPHRRCLDCPQGENVQKGQQETFEVDANMKTCSSCKVTKPAKDNYYESPAGSGRYGNECRACASARHKRAAALKKIQAGHLTPDQEGNINMANSEPTVQTLADTDPAANARRECEAHPADIDKDHADSIAAGRLALICKKCGHQGPRGDFYCIGNVPTDTCQTCAKAKRQTTLARNNPKQNPNLIVVDFTDFPVVLQNIEEDAKGNLRTVPNEILYRLLNPKSEPT